MLPKQVFNTYIQEMNAITSDRKKVGRVQDLIVKARQEFDSEALAALFLRGDAEGQLLLGEAFIRVLEDEEKKEKGRGLYLIAICSLLTKWAKTKPLKTFTLFVHQAIDGFTAKYDRTYPGLVKCQKGCSFCCYQAVLITEAEGTLISDYVKRNPSALVSKDQYLRQKSWPKEFRGTDWAANFPVAYRRCPFLSDQGLCNVYEVRPMACRSHRSVLSPQFCDPVENPGDVIASPLQEEISVLLEVAMNLGRIGQMAHEVNI